jgi:hypothetical protein
MRPIKINQAKKGRAVPLSTQRFEPLQLGLYGMAILLHKPIAVKLKVSKRGTSN